MKTKPIPFTKLEPEQMILHQQIGQGEYKGVEFELGTVIPSCSPVLWYKGERYLMNINDILQAMLQAIEEGGA